MSKDGCGEFIVTGFITITTAADLVSLAFPAVWQAIADFCCHVCFDAQIAFYGALRIGFAYRRGNALLY